MRIAAPMVVSTMPKVAPVVVHGASQGPNEQEAMLIERMSSSSTMRHIEELNRAPRVWKSPEYDRAVDYVTGELEAAGWDVHVEELDGGSWMGRGKLRNVVAERRGTAPDGDRKLVVAGAHLDSVRGAPGANDNASGSSTLIELAKSFDGIDTRNDIRLVWFDGEEAGLLGSKAHVKANAADSARTVAMINMDMVGSQFRQRAERRDQGRDAAHRARRDRVHRAPLAQRPRVVRCSRHPGARLRRLGARREQAGPELSLAARHDRQDQLAGARGVRRPDRRDASEPGQPRRALRDGIQSSGLNSSAALLMQ
jgi:hypothetical protein